MISKELIFRDESKSKKTVFWGTLTRKNKKISDDLLFMPFINFLLPQVFKPTFFSFLFNFPVRSPIFSYISLGLIKIKQNSNKRETKENTIFSHLTYTNLDVASFMKEFDEILTGLVGNLNNYNVNLLNELFIQQETA